MPLASAITIQQMIDQIKVEARIAGANNYDITVLAIINELLMTHTMTERYQELIDDAPIVTSAAAGLYALPVDFANIRTVWYGRAAEPPRVRTLRFKNDFIEQSRDGVEPNYYELVGGQLLIFPYGGVLATDQLEIEYWKIPNSLATTDSFPISRLYPVIKKEAISRMQLINKDFNSFDRTNRAATEQVKDQQTTEENGDNS